MTSNNKGCDEKVLDHVAYIARARQEIQHWKHPNSNVINKAMAALAAPIDKASAALMNAPQFGEALKQATEKTIVALSDKANATLDVQDVIRAYRNEPDIIDEYSVKQLSDIERLPLAVVDKQVKLFKSKYTALTSAQGITTGAIGWAGIPADVVGLIAVNLRAISEYATYYGFDMSAEQEQVFAMSLLAVATSNSVEERQAALDNTFNIVRDPKTLAFNKINEEVVSRVLRQTATKVATNLVKTKAAQVIPAVGALAAGGVNASYTASVCTAAYQCYRQRFLHRQGI